MIVEDGMKAIILAAGSSRRMGRDKALLDWARGYSLISVMLLRYSNPRVKQRVVVANPDNAAGIRAAIAGELGRWAVVPGGRVRADYDLVVNPDPAGPMMASIKLGLTAVGAGEGPVCIQPVDVFAVTPTLIEFLHENWRLEPEYIHQPACEGRGVHPVVIPERYVKEILALPAEGRLDEFLRDHAERVRKHEWLDRELLWNLNTPEDYERFRPLYDD